VATCSRATRGDAIGVARNPAFLATGRRLPESGSRRALCHRVRDEVPPRRREQSLEEQITITHSGEAWLGKTRRGRAPAVRPVAIVAQRFRSPRRETKTSGTLSGPAEPQSSVSRVLFRSCERWRSFLWDARLRAPRAAYPGARAGSPRTPLYVALLRMGFAMPHPLPDARWALTPPFHPYCRDESRSGLFSVALSSRSPSPGVTRHPALWSPDFPPAPRRERAIARAAAARAI
jgi:hypothetical protein